MKYVFCIKNSDLLESFMFQSEIDVDEIKTSNDIITFEIRRPNWAMMKVFKIFWITIKTVPSIISKVTISGVKLISVKGEKKISGDLWVETINFESNHLSIDSIDQSVEITFNSNDAVNSVTIEDEEISVSKKVFRRYLGDKGMDFKQWLDKYDLVNC